MAIYPTHVGLNLHSGHCGAGRVIYPTHVGLNRTVRRRNTGTLCIYPTHVGLNRRTKGFVPHLHDLPHARGVEPVMAVLQTSDKDIYPTHVGLNRPPALILCFAG